MSLSEDLRNELAAIAPVSDCDRLAELSGLFHVAGSVHLRGRGEVALHLDLVSSAVARRAFALLRAFDVDSEIRTYQRAAFDRATRYQLHVEGTQHAYETLHRAGVLDPSHRPIDHPPQRVVAKRCCRGAYLRGALLGAGRSAAPWTRTSRSVPRRSRARASSLRSPRGRARSCTCSSARGTRSRTRRGRRRSPTSSSPRVPPTSCSCSRSAPSSSATRADANRLANADHANLVRTSRAAHAQIDAVRRLDVDALPDDLRELAVLRLRHPTDSIAELARRCRPPASKASAYRRLRRLLELAE